MSDGIAEDLPGPMETSRSQPLRSYDGPNIVLAMTEITQRKVDFMVKYGRNRLACPGRRPIDHRRSPR